MSNVKKIEKKIYNHKRGIGKVEYGSWWDKELYVYLESFRFKKIQQWHNIYLKNKDCSVLGCGNEVSKKKIELYRYLRDIIVIRDFYWDDGLETLLKKLRLCVYYPMLIGTSEILAIAINREISTIVTVMQYSEEILGNDYPLLTQPNDHRILSVRTHSVICDNINLQKHIKKYSLLKKAFHGTL